MLINLEHVLAKPEFKHVRNENFIFYNHNLLEHLNDVEVTVEKNLGSDFTL